MKKICFKRLMSLVLCIITVLGSFPVSASAQTTDENGAVVYEIGDRVWMRGEEAEPAAESAPQGTFWIPEYDDYDQPVTRQGLCTKQEHRHVYACAPDCALAHTHSETCYTLTYPNCIQHSHDKNCTAVTVYACNKAEHDHALSACPAAEVCTVHDHSQCVIASAYTCGMEAHAHDESCTTPTYPECADHTEHTEACTPVTVYACNKAEHDHEAYGCTAVESCTVHDHSQCVMTSSYTCGIEAHVHDESCAPTLAYPNCTEHSHDKNCISENQLSCGMEEHICISEGCAPDCAIEEHSHTAECDMDALYYSWELVEDTSSTFAESSEKGLPVHFFIALPGQAAGPDDDYVRYAEHLWGNDARDDGRAYALPGVGNDQPINSQQGIRNANNENDITKYVDDNTKAIMAELKNFTSLTIDGTTYSGTDHEIKWVTICRRCEDEAWGWDYWKQCDCPEDNNPHIHIDAVLSQRVAPSELLLTKTIPTVEEHDQRFTFNLQRLMQDSNYNPVNPNQGFDTNFGVNGSVTLVADIPAGQKSAALRSANGEQVSFGYYKLTENTSTGWQINRIDIGRANGNNQVITGGDLYIQIGTDGSFRFSQSYNGNYVESSGITIHNQRRPLNVSYQWTGIPAQLVATPETATGIPYGSSHNINTTWKVGTRVQGQPGVMDGEVDSSGYYYEFLGWRDYESQFGGRVPISYNADGTPSPASFTVTSDTVVNGLWMRYELPKAQGYITINKEVENLPMEALNNPTDASFGNFYFEVKYNGTETEILPFHAGTWNEDKTHWTYQYPISADGSYTIVEGKYDAPGYDVDHTVTVEPVAGISTAGAQYTGTEIVSNGHKFSEFGQSVEISLPYDTAAFSDGIAAKSGVLLHTATVNFKNSYEKRTANPVDEQPNLIVRKTGGALLHPLTGAEFELKLGETPVSGVVEGADVRYAALAEGSYTLREIKAPYGYQLLDTGYTVNVAKDGEPVELLQPVCTAAEGHIHDTGCYSFVSTQKYKITITDENGKDVNEDSVPGSYEYLEYNTRISVPNEKIQGSLAVTKSFVDADGSALDPAVYGNAALELHVHGPITRDAAGAITDVGPVAGDIVLSANGSFSSTVPKLEVGEYVIREPYASIHGYTWLSVEYTMDGKVIEQVDVVEDDGIIVSGFAPFEITAENSDISISVKNTYQIWEAADFSIFKYKNGTDLGLGGAEFGLYTEQTCTNLYKSVTTGPAGVATFGDLTAEEGSEKVYYLREIKAPHNYYLDPTVYVVKVNHDSFGYDVQIADLNGNPASGWSTNDDTLRLYNDEILGNVTVRKTLQGDELPAGSYINVLLQGVDNNLSFIASLAEKDGWTHTFPDLPMGRYTITETLSSAAGYSYTTQYKLNNGTAADGESTTLTLSDNSGGTATSLPDSAKGEVEFINTYKRNEVLTVNAGNFTVIKRDEKGNALPGATFTLFADENCSEELSGMPKGFTVSATSGPYGQADFANLKLEDYAYGDYKTSEARKVVYYLKETEAPDGYQLSGKIWKITLTENKTQIDLISQRGNFFETIIDWIAGKHQDEGNSSDYEWIQNNTLAVVNYPILGSVEVSKSFADANGTALDQREYQNARVEFHIHGPITRDGNDNITDLGTERRIELKKGENSSFTTSSTLENLALGEYAIHEAFASVHGYSWTGKEYKVNGVVGTEQPVEGIDKSVFFNVTDATPVKIEVKNTYAEWDAADFYVRKLKTGTETELEGAVFSLYTYAECTTKVTGIGSQTTDKAGLAHFDGLEVDENKSVTYFLREDTAPTGYRRDETVYPVTVTHDADSFNVSIDTTGSSASWVTGTDTLWVYNEEILGEVQLTKRFVDAETNAENLGEYTPEAINLIFTGRGQQKTVTLNAENSWTETIDNLPMGRYAVYEQPASVAGYNLVSTAYTVSTVNQSDAGQGTPTVAEYATVNLTPEAHKQAVTVTNTYERINELTVNPASFRVLKKDENGNPLSGATFTLHSDPSCNSPLDPDSLPVGFTVSAISGEDGYAHFNYLKLADLGYSDYDEEYQQNEERTQTYYLKETAAPDGYDASQNIWVISLKEDLVSIGQYNAGKGFFETLVNWITDIVGNGTADEEVNWSNEQTITVTNNRIKGKLTLSKSFLDENGILAETAYENARIALHVHGPITRDEHGDIADIGPLVKEVIFAKDPNQNNNFISTATVENLVTGEYVIREPFPSVHGYTWQGVKYTDNGVEIPQESGVSEAGVSANGFAAFEITADKRDVTIEVKNSYKKWDAADFYVVKLKTGADGSENADNPKLPGATFKLYDDVACTQPVAANDAFTTEATTGVAGYAHFTGYTVPDGETEQVYYLKESNPPTNYSPDNTVYKLVIDHKNNEYDVHIKDLADKLHRNWDAARDALMVYNTEITGDITVKKIFAGADLGDKKPAGIEVTLSGNNITRTVTLNEGNKWTYQFTGLPMGEYTVVEQPIELEGYLLSTSYVVPAVNDSASGTEASSVITPDKATVVLAPSATSRDVSITNTYSKKTLNVSASTIEVVKLGENGQPLKDAVFTLYEDKNCTKTLENVPFAVSATSDENGLAVFSDLKLNDLDFDSYSTGSVRNKTFYMQESQAPAGYERSNTVWTITLDESYPKIDELSPDKSIFETVVNWLAGKHSSDLGGADYKWISGNRLQVINKPILGSVNISKSFVDANGRLDKAVYENARVELHIHGPITRDGERNITDIGPEHKIELKKDANGSFPTTATVDKLALGEYVIREPFASIHGYSWTDEEYYLNGGLTAAEEISIKGTDKFVLFEVKDKTPVSISVKNSYTQWDAADFYIRKLKTGTETQLSGAQFKLYTDTNCTTEVTGIAGYAHFDGLKVAQGATKTYYLREEIAPTNYRLDSTVYPVIVTHTDNAYDIQISVANGSSAKWISDTDTLWVYNDEIVGSITVSKVFEDIADEDKPAEIKFSLTGNGIDQEIVLPDENGNWKKTISNLPMGEYTIVEQPAIVDGYVLNTDYSVDSVAQNGATSATVELTTNKTDSTVTVTNSYEKKELTVVPTGFTVKKLETGSDKPLKDAVFLLYDENKKTIATATSGENGIALFEDLKMDDRDYEDYKDTTRSVTYYLTETVAPAGFEKDDTVWKVQLSERVTLFEEKNEQGKFGIVNWITDIFKLDNTVIQGNELTVYNSRKSYPVSVKKTVTYQGLTDPANDYMVKYNLSKAEYEFALYIDGGVQPVETVKLKAGEEKSFTKTVPYGSSYEIKELTAEKPIFSSVLSANAKGKVETELSGPIAVTAENTYRFTDGGKPIVLEMVKVSGDIYRRPLAGARFSLRDSGNELLGAYESDINGRFYISGVFNAPGTYWLIENRAPAGYRAGGPIAIDVKYDISVIYNADNQPVIVRTPMATVTGSHVFHIANNAYGVKNDVIFTPKTGDDNDLMLWSVLSLFGLLGTGSAFTLSRRKRYKSRH